jgi:alpha-tubulin suppressor-like RCC1 family protein
MGERHARGVAVAGVVALALGLPACLAVPDHAGEGDDEAVDFAPVEAIAGGRFLYCAIGQGGRVACWGDLDFEEGHDALTSGVGSPTPVLVADADGEPLVGITALAIGDTSACAIDAAASLVCWGYNDTGQLGRPSGAELDDRLPPGPVPGVVGATAVAVGASHACAIADEGLYCWGSDGDGKLGNGAPTGVQGPALSLSTAVAVAVGADHTCAVTADDEVVCAGSNLFGQLGQLDLAAASEVFVAVPDLSARTLDASRAHVCAITPDDGVACWGLNESGELGNGSTTESPMPTPQVVPVEDCSALSLGGASSCARCADEVVCWGNNGGGRLGIGNGSGGAVTSPTPLATSLDLADVVVGQRGGCARTTAGEVLCWGDNPWGALGSGETEAERPSVAVPLGPVDFAGL